MINFECNGFYGNSRKTWRGHISKLVYSGCHLELSVLLAQPVTACVCKTTAGYFVYFPHYECGVNLDSLFVVVENSGRLAAIFDEKDALTVAFAIGKVGHLLSKPRRRRMPLKSADDDGGLPF